MKKKEKQIKMRVRNRINTALVEIVAAFSKYCLYLFIEPFERNKKLNIGVSLAVNLIKKMVLSRTKLFIQLRFISLEFF